MAKGNSLSESAQRELRVALSREGLRPLARRLGVSTNTITAAASGQPLHGSSRTLIESGLGPVTA